MVSGSFTRWPGENNPFAHGPHSSAFGTVPGPWASQAGQPVYQALGHVLCSLKDSLQDFGAEPGLIEGALSFVGPTAAV